MSYTEIGAGLKPPVSSEMAKKYVRRWLKAAARYYPALEMREMFTEGLRQQLRLAMSKYSALEARDRGGNYLQNMDAVDRLELQLKIIARCESILVNQAEIHGLRRASVEINLPAPPERHETAISSLPPLEVQQRIREHAQQMRALMSATPVEAEAIAPTEPETAHGEEAPQEADATAEAEPPAKDDAFEVRPG